MPRDNGRLAVHRIIDDGRQARLGVLQLNLYSKTHRGFPRSDGVDTKEAGKGYLVARIAGMNPSRRNSRNRLQMSFSCSWKTDSRRARHAAAPTLVNPQKPTDAPSLRIAQNLKPTPARASTMETKMFEIGANWTNSNSPRRKIFGVSAQSRPPPTEKP
jgi:hypothetical protein